MHNQSKTWIVLPNYKIASRMQEKYPDIFFTAIGGSLVGRGFDLCYLVLDDNYSQPDNEKTKAWVDEILRCRALGKNSKLIEVNSLDEINLLKKEKLNAESI